ncbi:hypothetical protein [Prochlorothrix hollandica]|uniref:Uncharacterized protein n=1 Tax=Prochlorothrix hollandica PCC 9006 = CALU 1027 TaxID=317619 RepID=A0A0M2PUN8_PROHO|nr:hypothetical protein [Prochlorothrix hollandica]KKI98368.1 hypothetical protein PROH_19660 [Prochlorothrix hollandica PCC 9006 = CALU 1027]
MYNYTLTLSSLELNQLLKILYYQEVIPDQSAISLIAHINKILQQQGAMRSLPDPESYSQDSQALETMAAEIYHRYRENRTPVSDTGTGHHSHQSTRSSPGEDSSLVAVSSLDLVYQQDSGNGKLVPNASGSHDQVLSSIAYSLERMATYFGQQNPLGFSQDPLWRVIYCDGVEGATWYYRDELQRPVLIPTPVLTCKVQRLEFCQRQQSWKMQLYAMGDRPYCLESNYDSSFSKALLLALASLTPTQLQRPLAIESFPIANASNLTCRVYSNGSQVTHRFGSNPQWRDVAGQAMANIEASQGAKLAATATA